MHNLAQAKNQFPCMLQYIKNVKGIEPGIHGQTGPNAFCQSSDLLKPLGTTIKQVARLVITQEKHKNDSTRNHGILTAPAN
jgi:hypothetical protein